MSSASDHAEEGAPGERGGWEGSDVTEADIKWLRDSRRIPANLFCRVPKKEDIEPDVESGERVVFLDHFERGFGLPAGKFFRDFLDTFGLQPHHLPANAILQLSAYATFSERDGNLRSSGSDHAAEHDLDHDQAKHGAVGWVSWWDHGRCHRYG